MITQTIAAHFDGKVIVPDEPVELPVGEPLRVTVATEPPDGQRPPPAGNHERHGPLRGSRLRRPAR